MKTKFYFGAFAALALGFASCSSDEPINGPVDPDGPTTGEKYMAVVISDVGSNGKASLPGDNEFENPAAGSNESSFKAENVRFYFFTADGQPFVMVQNGVNGTVSHTNMVAPTELKTSNDNGAGATIQGVLVLGTTTTPYVGDKPAKVFCVANPIQTKFEDFANRPLNDLKTIVARYDQEKNPQSTFCFSSSTYASGTNEVFYTDVAGKIYDDPDKAKGDPAKIFLERLVAKVRVTGIETKPVKERTGDNTVAVKDFKINGVDGTTQLNVELVGWKLIKNSKTTYAIKNISSFIGEGNEPFENWNDPDRHRSYWAYTACQQSSDFFRTTYDIYKDAFPLKSFATDKPLENIAYCYGNTRFAGDLEKEDIANPVTARHTNATAILVKGIVKKAGEDAGLDFVYWGGEYFLTDNFKKVVVDRWNNEHGLTGTSAKTTDDVTFIDGTSPNSWKAKVGDSAYDTFDNILWWQEGVTSYYLNIKHVGGKFGVVRNHIYDYELTDVIGLGVPGNDPNDPKDPTENYLAAVVYCLNWRIVSNQTVLE